MPQFDALELQKIRDELWALRQVGIVGADVAYQALPLLDRVEAAGGFAEPRYARVRVLLNRWRNTRSQRWEEQDAAPDRDIPWDPDTITWDRICRELFPDLPDGNMLARMHAWTEAAHRLTVTMLQRPALERLQRHFGSDSMQKQVSALVVYCPVPMPEVSPSELARIAGNLPPLGPIEDEMKAGRLRYSGQLEQEGQFDSQTWMYGEAAALERYCQYATDACHVLNIGNSDAVAPGNWTRLLFNLAWRAIPGLALRAEKWTVRDGVRIVRPDQDLPPDAEWGRFFQSVLDGAESFTASALPDVCAASVAALDLFLAGAITPPIAGNADSTEGFIENLQTAVAPPAPDQATDNVGLKSATLKTKKAKRSTERGEGQAKLIVALTKHHDYANGSCLNTEPIGNNELARLAGVDRATASAFFKQKFKGHGKYKAACADPARLAAALKLLNGEYAPHLLYGAKPPDEAQYGDEA